MIPNLILLCGTARSGKSTVCDLMRRAFIASGDACHEAPLALLVKQELSSLLDVPVADQEAQRAAWRPLWQFWGTEARRAISGEFYWLRQWEHTVRHLAGHIIVPDVRFPNEFGFMAQFAQQRGMAFRAVLVRRSWMWEAWQWTKRQRWHSSERAWRPLAREFEWLIVNSGDMASLKKKVERMVEAWQ